MCRWTDLAHGLPIPATDHLLRANLVGRSRLWRANLVGSNRDPMSARIFWHRETGTWRRVHLWSPRRTTNTNSNIRAYACCTHAPAHVSCTPLTRVFTYNHAAGRIRFPISVTKCPSGTSMFEVLGPKSLPLLCPLFDRPSFPRHFWTSSSCWGDYPICDACCLLPNPPSVHGLFPCGGLVVLNARA